MYHYLEADARAYCNQLLTVRAVFGGALRSGGSVSDVRAIQEVQAGGQGRRPQGRRTRAEHRASAKLVLNVFRVKAYNMAFMLQNYYM